MHILSKLIKRFLIGAILFFTVQGSTLFNFEVKHYEDWQCIAANVYFEARGESYRGMQAVGAVTRNRMQSPKFKGTACQVVFARKQFSWTHQQSYDKILQILNGEVQGLSVQDQVQYGLAVWIAQQDKKYLDKILPSDTVYYHSIKVNPLWNRKMQKVAKIDMHVFYKEKLNAKH